MGWPASSSVLRLKAQVTVPGFCTASRDLNSGSDENTASTLQAEPPHQQHCSFNRTPDTNNRIFSCCIVLANVFLHFDISSAGGQAESPKTNGTCFKWMATTLQDLCVLCRKNYHQWFCLLIYSSIPVMMYLLVRSWHNYDTTNCFLFCFKT